MRRPLILLCAVLAGVAALPASAQELETGSLVNRRTPKPVGAHSSQRSVLVWHNFASCITRKRENSVRGLLNATTQAEVDKLQPALTREIECLGAQGGSDFAEGVMLVAPADIQRGMFAEALLDKMPHPLNLPALPRAREYHSAWTAVSGRAPSVEEMAVCVAATNPAGIEALVATVAESGEELAAFRALLPSFGPCLVNNVHLTANRQSMRAALAEALYHRTMAPAEPAQ